METTMDQALTVLRTKIREHINAKYDAIATGAALDFPRYRELVGEISGLTLAERELIDLLNVIKENQ